MVVDGFQATAQSGWRGRRRRKGKQILSWIKAERQMLMISVIADSGPLCTRENSSS